MGAPKRLGEYEIQEEIGRGGFGVVYRARQVSLDRPVALKVLYRNLIHTQDQISRFEREARAAARLDHPHIVAVYAWGEDDDDFFISQQLIGTGRTLADELASLRSDTTVPTGYFRRVAEMICQVARGLHHSHARGIIHRDVKPSNILLDDALRPFLGDFGLAKVEDGLELSRTGDLAGSPFYLSPEQADSGRGPITASSDIYSLGVTLYECLTLKQPFSGTTAHEIVRKILGEEPARPRRIQPRVPDELETIALKAMEKAPERRYPTAGALADDLQAFLDGEPISAQPISGTTRALRRVRRHRGRIAAGVLALVAVWSAWELSQYLMERDIQVRQQREQKTDVINQTQQLAERTVQDRADREVREALAAGDQERAMQALREKETDIAQIRERMGELSTQAAELSESELAKQARAAIEGVTDLETRDEIFRRVANFARDGAGFGALAMQITGADAEPVAAAPAEPGAGPGFFARMFGFTEVPPATPAAGATPDATPPAAATPPVAPAAATSGPVAGEDAPSDGTPASGTATGPQATAPWMVGLEPSTRAILVGGQLVLLPRVAEDGGAGPAGGSAQDGG